MLRVGSGSWDAHAAEARAGTSLDAHPPSSADGLTAQPISKDAHSHMQACAGVILDFLQSKCLVGAERALRTELGLMYNQMSTESTFAGRSLWQSQLEIMLNAKMPRAPGPSFGAGDEDSPAMAVMLSQVGQLPIH